MMARTWIRQAGRNRPVHGRMSGSVAVAVAILLLGVSAVAYQATVSEGQKSGYRGIAELEQARALYLADSGAQKVNAIVAGSTPAPSGYLDPATCSASTLSSVFGGVATLGSGTYQVIAASTAALDTNGNKQTCFADQLPYCNICYARIEGRSGNAKRVVNVAVNYQPAQGISGRSSTVRHRLPIRIRPEQRVVMRIMGWATLNSRRGGTDAVVNDSAVTLTGGSLSKPASGFYLLPTRPVPSTTACAIEANCLPNNLITMRQIASGNGQGIGALANVLTIPPYEANTYTIVSNFADTAGAPAVRDYVAVGAVLSAASGQSIALAGSYGLESVSSGGALYGTSGNSNTISGAVHNPLLSANPVNNYWCDGADTLLWLNAVELSSARSAVLDSPELHFGGGGPTATENPLVLRPVAQMLAYNGLSFAEVYAATTTRAPSSWSRSTSARADAPVQASFTASASGTTLTVTAMTANPSGATGVIRVGQSPSSLTCGGNGKQQCFTTGTTITGYGSGSGGVGTYTLSASHTLTSRATTAQSSSEVLITLTDSASTTSGLIAAQPSAYSPAAPCASDHAKCSRVQWTTTGGAFTSSTGMTFPGNANLLPGDAYVSTVLASKQFLIKRAGGGVFASTTMTDKPLCSGICSYFNFTQPSGGGNKPPSMTTYTVNQSVPNVSSYAGVFACVRGVDPLSITYVPGLMIKPGAWWSDF